MTVATVESELRLAPRLELLADNVLNWANGSIQTKRIFGGGSSSSMVTTATADVKLVEFRCSTTATSGDNRLMYLRYSLDNGGGGECLRASTIVGSNLGTAHGAHFGLEFEAVAGASECSGLGVGLRGTLMIPNIASWAPTGTYAAGMFEIFSEGTNSDPAGMTELSVLRLVNSGGSGKADVDTDAVLFSIQGFAAAADTTKVVTSIALAEVPGASVGIKVKVGAAFYYIPCVPLADYDA
jgi:hypothetical protein